MGKKQRVEKVDEFRYIDSTELDGFCGGTLEELTANAEHDISEAGVEQITIYRLVPVRQINNKVTVEDLENK